MAYLAWPKANPFFDNNGNLLAGGVLRIYDAQTTSYKTVYKDSDGTVPWTNGITLDSSGRLSDGVYIGAGAWKYTLETSAGVVLVTQDDIPGEVVVSVDAFARPNMPVLSKSLSYTVLADDIGSMIQADATGGDVTITLISAIAAGNGAQIGVQNVGTANRVIVTVPGGEQINGVSSVQILAPRAGGVFTSNAGAWSGALTAQPFSTLSKTTTYTVGVEDYGKTVKADASGGAFTVTMPPAASAGDGFEVTILKTDNTDNVVTIDGDASETVNDAANAALRSQWGSIKLRSDASNWQVVSESGSGTPPGSILSYGGTSAPNGWLLCYGQAISRTTYAALFSAIGTTYGAGDGATTFNIPDIRGRVIAGQDDMGGTSANRLTGQSGGLNGDTLGASGGSETHALTESQNGPHLHKLVANDDVGSTSRVGTNDPIATQSTAGSNTTNYFLQAGSSAVDRGVSSTSGSGAAHNNVQPTIILNYIIKI